MEAGDAGKESRAAAPEQEARREHWEEAVSSLPPSPPPLHGGFRVLGAAGQGPAPAGVQGREGFLAARRSGAGRYNRRQLAGLDGRQAAKGRLPGRAGTC